MTRSRASKWKTLVVVLAALAIIILGSLLLKWIGLDPNAFAAVASALAAIAAFASARESSSTARDAVRALSLASKPAPKIALTGVETPDGPAVNLVISNPSLHPVDHATVSWTLRDGTRGTRTISRMEAVTLASPASLITDGSSVYIQIPQPAVTGTDEVTLDYWGTTGPTGWRLTQTFEHTFTSTASDNGAFSASYGVHSPTRTETELT